MTSIYDEMTAPNIEMTATNIEMTTIHIANDSYRYVYIDSSHLLYG